MILAAAAGAKTAVAEHHYLDEIHFPLATSAG
jgi:hypothetical protein